MHLPLIDLLFKPNLYLDPGSGSLLFQMLLAGLVGVTFAVKIFWRKIKGIFHKNGETAPTEDISQDGPGE